MAKPGAPLPGAAGLAEWLPLLGSICQVLAALGEDKAADAPKPPEPPEPSAAGGASSADERAARLGRYSSSSVSQ